MNFFSTKPQNTSNPMSTTTNQTPNFGMNNPATSGLGGSSTGLGGI